ncbi:hypothetical protein RF679_13355 [Undibacterium cyanobacteriorum]|uniref:DUF2157 domain-containing protein n=1 Tax=Undibacterium cyanobacteriorum TaxID=3073561 RepID=A0ABY9RH74_9BURK|nr:hypothetical protein [Undibacterium sp. 20NA77.5]WMW79632.1 hypothetical protein RF679_13355 [Undibacterium sp. 20NA77.5]
MKSQKRRQALMEAADLGLLYYGQVKPLVEFMEQRERRQREARWNGSTMLTYCAGLLVVAICTMFSTLALEKWGMTVLFELSLMYCLASLLCALWFHGHDHRVPTNFFATIFIMMVPMLVFSVQNMMGYWPAGHTPQLHDLYHVFDRRWFVIEAVTVVSALLVLWFFKRSYLVIPVLLSLFLMAWDLLPNLLLGMDLDSLSPVAWNLRKAIALIFGFAVLVLGFIVDMQITRKRDYAFWLYSFGLLSFSGSLALYFVADQGPSFAVSYLGQAVYFSINGLLLLLSAALQRRSFAVAGALGIAFAMMHGVWQLFQGSFAIVGALITCVFAYLMLAMWWSHNEHRFAPRLRGYLPDALQNNLLWRH